MKLNSKILYYYMGEPIDIELYNMIKKINKQKQIVKNKSNIRF